MCISGAEDKRMMYYIARAVCRFILKYIRGWEINGLDKVPRHGGLVIVANHTSLWDPVIAGCAMKREVRYMAKEELYKINPAFSWLLKNLLTFPVKRGQMDRAALKYALDILKGGGILGLFPEGTRSKSGELNEARNGAAMLAIKTGVPVLPVGISGAKGWGKVKVYIGEPIPTNNLSDGKITKDVLSEFSHVFMKSVEELVEENNQK